MNMWGSRASSVIDDEGGAQGVAENVGFAAAPTVGGGATPATTLWWDGFTIAKNVSDEDAEATFELLVGNLNADMANANGDDAVWLIDGYTPTATDEGVLASAQSGAKPYPMLPYAGLMHTALGAEIVEFLQGSESAEKALEDVEAAYVAAAKEGGFL
jgi:ABC-type glycerol-3-phosphate transport system substrate-binding protein